jgi:16S rRNA (adenine1518-N6/adenine1519-N6)-dimethyltransferase
MHPKQLLELHQIEPKKSMGQNFLFDPHVLARIAATAELTPADAVLEVGPGLGSLTQLLAEQAGRVVAVELDDRLLPLLQAQVAHLPQVTIVHGDILAQNPADWFATEPHYKVVANVPYYITGGILRHLLTAVVKPELMVLTVQKEVAERVTAVGGEMSLLAVSVQFYGHATLVMNLAAGSFWPRPGVDSTVLKVDLRQRVAETTAVGDETAFFRIVRAGFSQKRKQLQKNLRQLAPQDSIEAWLKAANLDGSRRAETLTLEEWVALYQTRPVNP